MNTHMYSHPLTAKHLKMVREELGYEVHGPIGKTLACGDVGECPIASPAEAKQAQIPDLNLRYLQDSVP